MKKMITLMFLAFLSIAESVSAQTFVESQNRFEQGKVSPTIDAQLIVPGKTVDFTGWFLVSENWGEALIGVSKSVRPWLWVGFVAGVETNEGRPLRMSPEVWMGNGRVSFFLVTEHGGSGHWYKNTGLVRVSPRLEVGYHSQRFYGTGPMVKVDLGHKVSLWASTALDTHKSIVGLKKAF